MNPFPKTPFYIGAIILLMTFTFVTYSQIAQSSEKFTAEDRAERWNTWMKEQLTLTAEQEAKTQEINLKYARQNEKLRISDASRGEKFKEFRAGSKSKDAELKLVLTKDQFKIYKEKKKVFQREMLQSMKTN